MRSIHPRKIILSFIFLLPVILSSAQGPIHHFDLRKFNLGFLIGGTYASYKTVLQTNVVDPQTRVRLNYIDLKPKYGINLGLISNFKISNHFDFRFVPLVSLEQRDFDFHYSGRNGSDSVEVKKIENSNLNLSFLMKFKSGIYRDYRVYVEAGPTAMWNLASNAKVKDDKDLLKTSKMDFGISVALGVDLYGERIKLSPQLKYTLGLVDTYQPRDTRFGEAISYLRSQTIAFILNFE